MRQGDPGGASILRRALVVVAASVLLLAVVSRVAAPAMAQPASLVGAYDGRQMEIAAGIELKADGRFQYGLSYGALDEAAAGRWTMRGNQVLLTSDPVTAPRFVLVLRGKGSDTLLRVDLDLPKGVSRQYFDALITTANDATERKQLAEDGLSWPFAGNDAPRSVRLMLQMFDIASQPVRLDPSSGYSVRFRFEPNDLGKVSFQATPLAIANGELLLDRHGRTIRFKRTGQ